MKAVSAINEAIRQHFPVLYELYEKPINERRLKKRNKWFSTLTTKQMMDCAARQYYEWHKRELDWNNLVTYTEKMQWYKIFDRNPQKTLLTDKITAKDWVAEKIGSEYVIPIIKVYDKYSDIDFAELPNRFVIKTNHASQDAVVVRDRKNMSLAEKLHMRRIITNAMVRNHAAHFFELNYLDIPAKILVEEYVDTESEELRDYKFYCFDGVPVACRFNTGINTDHKRSGMYDMDWNPVYWGKTFNTAETAAPKPENLDKMLELVKKLSEGIPHVRVDLYDADGKLYFGEMTFTSGAGLEDMNCDVDRQLGKLCRLDTKIPDGLL